MKRALSIENDMNPPGSNEGILHGEVEATSREPIGASRRLNGSSRPGAILVTSRRGVPEATADRVIHGERWRQASKRVGLPDESAAGRR
jgi:hypothetical protein